MRSNLCAAPLAIDDCAIHRSQKSTLAIPARGIRTISRRWSMRTCAPIDLSFRSVDLIPSEHLPRTKCMRLYTRQCAFRGRTSLSGREKGREWEMHPDGTVSFTCMRTIPRDDTVTSMRFPASSRVFDNDFWLGKTLQFHRVAIL